jgi:hypothetical protein
MGFALPTGGNRYERQAEAGKVGERKQSPWSKPLPKEKASTPTAPENPYEGQKESGTEEKIRQINDSLRYLGAAKEKAKAGSGRKEGGESRKAENLGKEDDGRVIFEMSYGQFVRLMRGKREEEEKPLILKEAPHPVLEAIDMAFDLIAWLIMLFLSPILEEDEDKKEVKKEEDDWYGGHYEKRPRSQLQEDAEDDSGTVKIYRYGPKTHETRQGFEAAGSVHA